MPIYNLVYGIQTTPPGPTPILPAEYQQVEYIESSGTQRMAIGTSFKSSYKVVMDFQMTVTGSDQIPLGLINSSNYKFGINAYDSKFYIASGGNNWTATGTEDSSRHTITLDKSTITIDSTNYTSSYTDRTFNIGIGVFDYKRAQGNVYFPSSNKLFKLDIYDENAVHIYDLYPCYRKSDIEIGLYDIINDEFYTNVGSGILIKGPDVN